jgi:hypothetical protein
MGLDLRGAAVDEQLGAGDKAGIVRGQEYGCLADLIGIAEPAHRHLRGKELKQSLLVFDFRSGKFGEACCTGRTGTEGLQTVIGQGTVVVAG